MRKYNNFSSYCDVCRDKGYHEKETKCLRTIFKGCKTCGSHQNVSKESKCTGTNVLIDYSDISKQFVYAYESGQRIKVQFSYGDIKTGTVGMTTGWKPVFILMLRSNSIGSSHILTDKDIIL